jgi:hypothetical protein
VSFRVEAPREAGEIYDLSFVRAGADLFGIIGRTHRKLDAMAIGMCYLGLSHNLRANRRRCEMANVDPRAAALSPGSRQVLIAFSAAFSITMIMTGVARTPGSVESLKRFAKCSARTTSANRPLAPIGISFIPSPR